MFFALTPKKTYHNMRKLYIILSLALILSSCHNHKKAKTAPLLKVEVCTALSDSIYRTMSFTSQLEAINSAIIQPRVSGYLQSIDYSGGKKVHKGQLLFQIEPGTFQSAMYAQRAAVEQSTANLLVSERNYQRAMPLVKIDAISRSDYDQYKATYTAAKADLKAAEENLKTAQLNLSYTKIYSPLEGIASKTSAAIGDYVGLSTSQSELCVISELDSMTCTLALPTATYLLYNIPTKNLLSNIRLKLSDSEYYPYKGEYYYTKKDTPTNSSTVAIVVKFFNPHHTLRPGMFARIEANIGTAKPAILIPQKAVSQMQGVNTVWVLKKDNTTELRQVKLGKKHKNLWQVSKGISAGEKVLLSGTMKIREGEKVAPQEIKLR